MFHTADRDRHRRAKSSSWRQFAAGTALIDQSPEPESGCSIKLIASAMAANVAVAEPPARRKELIGTCWQQWSRTAGTRSDVVLSELMSITINGAEPTVRSASADNDVVVLFQAAPIRRLNLTEYQRQLIHHIQGENKAYPRCALSDDVSAHAEPSQ